jgi:hypothetical protein
MSRASELINKLDENELEDNDRRRNTITSRALGSGSARDREFISPSNHLRRAIHPKFHDLYKTEIENATGDLYGPYSSDRTIETARNNKHLKSQNND